MSEAKLFMDKFYSEREILIREQIGSKLDTLKKDLKQLYSPCMSRLMNADQQVQTDKGLTIADLLNLEPSKRQMIVTATMYNDALWRLEAAYLMLCIGMLNVAYSNLRSCLETVIAAHIVENIESQSIKFLNRERINQADIAPFIPEKYNESIKAIKDKLGEWGVHSGVESIMIGISCNPKTFDKMISDTKVNKPQELHPEFFDFANTCIRAIGQVFIIFMFIMSKGTKYNRGTVNSR